MQNVCLKKCLANSLRNIFFTSQTSSWPDLMSPYSKLWSNSFAQELHSRRRAEQVEGEAVVLREGAATQGRKAELAEEEVGLLLLLLLTMT